MSSQWNPRSSNFTQHPVYQKTSKAKKNNDNGSEGANMRVIGFIIFLVVIGCVIGGSLMYIYDAKIEFHAATTLIANRDVTLMVQGGLDCTVKQESEVEIDRFDSDDLNGSAEPNNYMWVHSTNPNNQCSGKYSLGFSTIFDWRIK